MKKYLQVSPEVPGGLGEDTILDNNHFPPLITQLHFEFDGWLGDDLITTFPCFLVTERLKKAIMVEKLSGISFSELKVTKSRQFETIYPNKALPEFSWMKVNGIFGVDDFVLSNKYRLLISEATFQLLASFNVGNALIENYFEE